jgi:hypothetical protein
MPEAPGIYYWRKKPKPINIYIPTVRPDRLAKREELVSEGVCNHCGKAYSWIVQMLHQSERPENQRDDDATRCMALFLEYRDKGIGPCCVPHDHRTFIVKNTGMVRYNDFRNPDLMKYL